MISFEQDFLCLDPASQILQSPGEIQVISDLLLETGIYIKSRREQSELGSL